MTSEHHTVRIVGSTGCVVRPARIVSAAVDSPAVTGLFRPVLLPKDFPAGLTRTGSGLIGAVETEPPVRLVNRPLSVRR